MKKINLLTAVPLFVLLLVSFVPGGFAQDQQTPHQHDSQQMSQDQSISGELKSVDPDAKQITITTADGSDVQFVYNDQTQCTGAQDTVEGLSANSGSKLTVYYRDENQQKVATRIEVEEETKTDQTQEATPQQPDKETPPPDMQPPNTPEPNRPPDNPEQPLPAPPQDR